MKRFNFLLIAMLAIGLTLSACGGGGPLTVQTVTLSNTSGGAGATTFSPADRTIYAAINLSRLETGLTAKVTWTAVDTSAGQNLEIGSKEFTGLVVNVISAQVELPQDWPTGTYKLDVYLNGALANTTTFTIQ
jgi:ABC-type glycerol-3-phosphate transport system substrate-binding protein